MRTSLYIIYFSAILFIGLLSVVKCATDDEGELLLVHSLCTHGEAEINATEDLSSIPATSTKPPEPKHHHHRDLSKRGKEKCYKVGGDLRKRYGKHFEGKRISEILEATSIEYSRSAVSAQLVLAGLFPPEGAEIWSATLNWQPTYYRCKPAKKDKILLGIENPAFLQLYQAHMSSAAVVQVMSQFDPILAYISTCTGGRYNTISDAAIVYNILRSMELRGETLPAWTISVYPQVLENLAMLDRMLYSATLDMAKISVGFLLRKVISDTKITISGTSEKKIILYSVDATNIVSLLNILGIVYQRELDYGAYINIEVRRINGVVGVKLLYQDYRGSSDEPIELEIPDCGTFCSWDKFIQNTARVIPPDSDPDESSECDD